MTVVLICPSCGEPTNELWCFRFCSSCWYVTWGGDQAPDLLLTIPPNVQVAVVAEDAE